MHRARTGRLPTWSTAVIATPLALIGAAAASSPAAAVTPHRVGTATVVSVDGPARLTLKTKKSGSLRLRLIGVDTPQVGECGSTESVAELKRLVEPGKKTLRYELSRRDDGKIMKDSGGRWLGWLSPVRRSWTDASISVDLVATEWARGGDPVAAGAAPRELSDWSSTFIGDEPWGERAPRGVWAKCGGRMHLPSAAAVPVTEATPWAVSADGITEAIGPIKLSPTLSPASTLTVAAVATLAPVELINNQKLGGCDALVPSLQLVLRTTTPPPGGSCSAADIYSIASTGPNRATTTRGVGVGTPAAEVKAAFPLAFADEDRAGIYLTGPPPVLWTWQTALGVNDTTSQIDGFVASTGAIDGD